ncbi:MAG TPA: SufD family Fe-S cluster assembly protein, partial [Gemmatimonadaceae bacterium]
MAVEHLVGAYRAWASNGAANAPAWLKTLRDTGISRFSELGFPNMKQEAWRFTSVAPIAESSFELAQPASALPSLDVIAPFLLEDATSHRLVFVNGFFAPSLSLVSSDGVRVESLAQALVDRPEIVQAHLGKYAVSQDRPFCALNTAFVREGAFVHVPAKAVVQKPIQLLFLAVPGKTQQIVMHPRNLVVVDREARASVVETYAALEPDVYWTNSVTEVVVGDGARVDYHRVQRESARAYHVAATQTHQGRDSTIHLHTVAFGGAL